MVHTRWLLSSHASGVESTRVTPALFVGRKDWHMDPRMLGILLIVTLCLKWHDLITRLQIFQLSTNEPLFPVLTFGCTTDEIHTLLLSTMHDLFENGKQEFAKYISKRLPDDFGNENIERLTDFLWSMVQEHPEDRVPTLRLLKHSFLS